MAVVADGEELWNVAVEWCEPEPEPEPAVVIALQLLGKVVGVGQLCGNCKGACCGNYNGTCVVSKRLAWLCTQYLLIFPLSAMEECCIHSGKTFLY